jgi:hypothetical protein
VLSPWHISGTSVQVTLTGGSDENPGDEIGGGLGFANGPRPGRVVSAVEERRYDSHINFDVISVPRVKKITFE